VPLVAAEQPWTSLVPHTSVNHTTESIDGEQPCRFIIGPDPATSDIDLRASLDIRSAVTPRHRTFPEEHAAPVLSHFGRSCAYKNRHL
jgi:hypothetical protein